MHHCYSSFMIDKFQGINSHVKVHAGAIAEVLDKLQLSDEVLSRPKKINLQYLNYVSRG